LLVSHLSPGRSSGVCVCRPNDDPDDDVGLAAGLTVLFASHLSTASARQGLGASGMGRMTTHRGAWSSGATIFHLSGVGSSAGRAACAMARCTRATGIAMSGQGESGN
jgi:hypothetical protein